MSEARPKILLIPPESISGNLSEIFRINLTENLPEFVPECLLEVPVRTLPKDLSRYLPNFLGNVCLNKLVQFSQEFLSKIFRAFLLEVLQGLL